MAKRILKKLTLREILGSKQKCLALALTGATADEEGEFKGTGKLVDAAIITGRVFDCKVGEGDNGTFIKLMGNFQGKNLATGNLTEEVGICIMPNHVANRIASAIAQGSRNIEFKVKFLIRFNETAATQYEFEAENLVEDGANVSSLASLWGSDAPELVMPAPVKKIAANIDQSTGEIEEPAKAPAPAPARKPAPAPAPAAKKRSR